MSNLDEAAEGRPLAAAQASGATIQAYPDGPLIVRGEFAIQDHLGAPIANDRRTVALCRCGRSAIKPFCDGAHKTPRRRDDGVR
jgi:hypothetical protein